MNEMSTKTTSWIPILLIALLTGGFTLIFLSSLRQETDIVVAARGIAVGARLTAEDLTLRRVRAMDVLPGALTSVDDALGQVISVQRLAGDAIGSHMLGSEAISAIARGLPLDHRAVAVTVSRAGGLAGVLRPGDRVTLIAVVEPPLSLAVPDHDEHSSLGWGVPGGEFGPGVAGQSVPPVPADEPTLPRTAFARITASGLQVLLVPQTFRYEEATTTDVQGFAAVQSSQVGQREGVIVLDVPAKMVDVGRMQLLLPELIALLDAQARVYLALEPASAPAVAGVGISMEQLMSAGIGQTP